MSLQDSPLTWPAIAAIGGFIVQALSFFYIFLKDVRIQARRTRVLEQTKLQFDVWDKWCDLQLKLLPEWELDVSKKQALVAIEHVRRQADSTLRALNPTANPVIIEGLPQWRHKCLLYRPKAGSKFSGYVTRLFLLLSFLLVAATTFIFVVSTYPYLQSSSGSHNVKTVQNTHPHPALVFGVFLLVFLYFEFLCISLYMSIYKEGAAPVIQEIDRL